MKLETRTSYEMFHSTNRPADLPNKFLSRHENHFVSHVSRTLRFVRKDRHCGRAFTFAGEPNGVRMQRQFPCWSYAH